MFYSRTGNTKKFAEKIANNLNVDIDEKDRSGIKGWFSGPIDILLGNETEIENKKNKLEYDLVVIGTPV